MLQVSERFLGTCFFAAPGGAMRKMQTAAGCWRTRSSSFLLCDGRRFSLLSRAAEGGEWTLKLMANVNKEEVFENESMRTDGLIFVVDNYWMLTSEFLLSTGASRAPERLGQLRYHGEADQKETAPERRAQHDGDQQGPAEDTRRVRLIQWLSHSEIKYKKYPRVV